MSTVSSAALVQDDEGFGLIEIVVSMFMLALLSLSMLPLLVTSVQQSARNVTLASANQLVQQQLEKARGATTCGALGAAVNASTTTSASSVDSRGVPLQLTEIVAACTITPNTPQGTVNVTVRVIRTDTDQTLSRASTLVYVSGN